MPCGGPERCEPPVMKPSYCRNVLLLLAASVLLGGCETIGSLFPDKQKQYKYSTEIPPLEVPPDLSSSTIDGAVPKRGVGGTEDAGSLADREAAAESAATPPGEASEQAVAESEPSRPAAPAKKSEAAPTLAQSSNDVPLIEIEAPFEIAWGEVAKALGRMELEISDQNRSDGLYYVYYGGDRKPYEDRGFFGDLAEMFGKGQEQSKEYRVKLEGRTQKLTTVYVLDADNKPQLEGPGFELLKRLHETLQAMAAPGKGEKPAAEGSAKPES
jgi:outer membrane protein assembly factor BamC